VIERFDPDDLPPPRRSDVRDRLVALDQADRARAARRHRPHADLVWLVLVLFALLLALLLGRSS
jgi:hypothetical protein